jgi:hypothetical protein
MIMPRPPAIATWITGLAQGITSSVTQVSAPSAGVNEEQLLTLTTIPNAYGSFTVSRAGQTTVAIALALNTPTAMAAALQTALENLAAIGAGNVTVAYAGSPAAALPNMPRLSMRTLAIRSFDSPSASSL